jgi:hypothetical protein
MLFVSSSGESFSARDDYTEKISEVLTTEQLRENRVLVEA